ncbi:MAG: YaaC family protein [Methyloceanibacter sp.]|uniref:YaaC family protein n=1 Tax=Methyloceanibacter sp. TaxID=1965321 RepID=UPI003D9B5FB7
MANYSYQSWEMYAIAFILGMLTRYHPSHWIGFQTLGPKGHFYPFCSRLLDHISYSFLRMVADILSNLNRLN